MTIVFESLQTEGPEPLMKTRGARGRVYDSILDTIGATPLVRLPRMAAARGYTADLLAKLEFFNPLASVKDRIGFAMLEQAEREGLIRPGKTTLIEPTSGNTGIGLAFVAAAKGYTIILTMPESMSVERRKMLRYLGADLVLTPADKGMKGAIDRAAELVAATPGAWSPSQFDNPANPRIHQETTAEEIWTDTGGAVDILVGGVGTGGTLTGCGQALKAKKPGVRVVAGEPTESPVLSGGAPGPHKIQGIGAGFVPSIMDMGVVDEVVKVDSATAFATAREVARTEGLPAGISSGAALHAGMELAGRPENAGAQIVVIVPSFAERYISTLLFDGLGD
jgi:cysteine synthase